MNRYKTYIKNALLVMVTMLAVGLTSCSDEMPEEDLYTYQAEMLSDYLRNHDNFSQFARIVEKAGKMDLLSSYGRYTCFAPTNDAINSYLASHTPALSSVEQLSSAECDTLTCTMIVNELYTLTDLLQCEGNTQANLLGRELTLEEKQITINDPSQGPTSVVTFRVNGAGTILYELANDSVENGIVHPIDGVIPASKNRVPDVIKMDKSLTIFATCMELTGIDQQMIRKEDASYNYKDWEYLQGQYPSDNHKNWCHVPRTRLYGYTAFCVPDEILNHYSEFEDTHYDKNIYTWEDMYDYACTKYPEGAGASYYGKDLDALKDERNPLHKLIAYHMLDRKAMYNRLYTDCTIYHGAGGSNPTEWYSTMNPLSTIKVEKVYAANKFKGTSLPDSLYINRMYDPTRPNLTERGAIIYQKVREDMRLEQRCENGVYYYIDRLIDYGQNTRDHVFNTRIRMDLYTFWPELMSNDIRSTVTNSWDDCSQEASTPWNYIFPPGYFDNVEAEEGGDFIYQGCRNYYWSYEGDEFNLRSDNNSYDVTFRLPSVPEGTYQIRLGFCLIPSRGIAQFYVDGMPQGIPLDMRSTGWVDRVGWKALSGMNAADAEQNKKDLHNQGWYHGPKTVRNFGGDGIAHPDAELSTSQSPFCDNTGTVRRVIYTGPLKGDKIHTMRIRSVWADGGAELMLDYIELVPKSVYGIDQEGQGEDDL